MALKGPSFETKYTSTSTWLMATRIFNLPSLLQIHYSPERTEFLPNYLIFSISHVWKQWHPALNGSLKQIPQGQGHLTPVTQFLTHTPSYWLRVLG